MKILMLNYEFPPVGGGASPVTFQLSRHLVQLGHHVDVVTMRYRDCPKFESVEGINVYRTPAWRKKPDICRIHEMATYLPGALGKTLRLTRKIEHDIIHCHFIIPTGPLAGLVSILTGIPYLITCHGSDVPGYNPDRFSRAHKLLMPAWRKLVSQTPLLVSPSASLIELIRKHAPSTEVSLVPNGINLQTFHPDLKEKSILLCSRILPRKGFQYALEAIDKIKLDWPVHIIGDGPYLAELKRMAENNSAPITFWGWLDQKDPRFHQLYEAASIFIFPSEAENFPTVLLEAMSAGMAVITSTAGGCPEVVGDAGLLVEPRNSGAIAEQLEKLVNSEDLRQDLSQAARQRAETFSWSFVTQKYLDCYQRVLQNKVAPKNID